MRSRWLDIGQVLKNAKNNNKLFIIVRIKTGDDDDDKDGKSF